MEASTLRRNFLNEALRISKKTRPGLKDNVALHEEEPPNELESVKSSLIAESTGRRPQNRSRSSLRELEVDEILRVLELVNDEKLTYRQVSDRLSCRYSTVKNILRKFRAEKNFLMNLILKREEAIKKKATIRGTISEVLGRLEPILTIRQIQRMVEDEGLVSVKAYEVGRELRQRFRLRYCRTRLALRLSNSERSVVAR